MNTFITWLRAKFGRITTGLGILLQGIETIDISMIKDPLESFLGHKGVQAIIIGLFVASYLRHQYVASRLAPKPDILPAPVVKLLLLFALAIAPRVHAADVTLTWIAPTTNSDGSKPALVGGYTVTVTISAP